MIEKKTDASEHKSAAPINQVRNGFADKGTDSFFMYKILLMLSTRKASAEQLNSLTGADDSNKYISRLRQRGIQILDCTNSSGRKVFFTELALKCSIFNTDDADGSVKHLNTNSHE